MKVQQTEMLDFKNMIHDNSTLGESNRLQHSVNSSWIQLEMDTKWILKRAHSFMFTPVITPHCHHGN